MQNETVKTVRHVCILLRGIHLPYIGNNPINHEASVHNHLTIFYKYQLKIFTSNTFGFIHFPVPINNLSVKQETSADPQTTLISPHKSLPAISIKCSKDLKNYK